MIVAFFIGNWASAQEPGWKMNPEKRKERQEKMIAKKFQYAKKTLELTEPEAKQFKSVYSKYEHEKIALREAMRKEIFAMRKDGKIQEMNDKELRGFIDKKLEIDKKNYELDRDYTIKLTKILPPKKVVQFFRLDKQFNRRLLRRLGERRGKLEKRRGKMERRKKLMEKRKKMMQEKWSD